MTTVDQNTLIKLVDAQKLVNQTREVLKCLDELTGRWLQEKAMGMYCAALNVLTEEEIVEAIRTKILDNATEARVLLIKFDLWEDEYEVSITDNHPRYRNHGKCEGKDA